MDQFLEYIAASRAKILKRKQRLDEELVELDRAEKLYRASGAATVTRTESPQDSHADSTVQTIFIRPTPEQQHLLDESQARFAGTIKERVLALLDEVPAGLTSTQILTRLQAAGMPHLQRTSLSPQLSRLKQAHVVDLRDGVWVRAEKVEPEDGAMSSGSE